MEHDRYFFFYGAQSPLSNFHPSEFVVRGVRFTCGEMFLMYCKAKLFGDEVNAQRILCATHPLDMKKAGREVRPFDGQRWSEKRLNYDYFGNLHRFQQNPDLASYLLATGDKELVEASRDLIWGIGLPIDSPTIAHQRLWRGQNLKGISLMRVRDELRKQTV